MQNNGEPVLVRQPAELGLQRPQRRLLGLGHRAGVHLCRDHRRRAGSERQRGRRRRGRLLDVGWRGGRRRRRLGHLLRPGWLAGRHRWRRVGIGGHCLARSVGRRPVDLERKRHLMRTARKGAALAAKAVEHTRQRQSKAAETHGKGSVLAAKAAEHTRQKQCRTITTPKPVALPS